MTFVFNYIVDGPKRKKQKEDELNKRLQKTLDDSVGKVNHGLEHVLEIYEKSRQDSIKERQKLYDTIDKMGACGDDYVARVDIITLEKTIAAVRVIEDNWHGYKFTDLLIMNKINGEWKIVAKVYDTLSFNG